MNHSLHQHATKANKRDLLEMRDAWPVSRIQCSQRSGAQTV